MQLTELFRKHPVLLAYLFGSQVTGRTHQESDIDVAVLLDESLTADQRLQERLALLNVLCSVFNNDNVDLVILNDATPLLAYEALRGGQLLFCPDESARIEFQVRTVRTYEDTAPLRQALFEALVNRTKENKFGVGPKRSKR